MAVYPGGRDIKVRMVALGSSPTSIQFVSLHVGVEAFRSQRARLGPDRLVRTKSRRLMFNFASDVDRYVLQKFESIEMRHLR